MSQASYWIEKLQLVAHPEGGHFRETYRSSEMIGRRALPIRFSGPRSFSTAIYFLLQEGEYSALHRIAADETWHFYDGAPLEIHIFTEPDQYTCIELGRDIETGQTLQVTVPAGAWFGARVKGQGDFALVGCTVAPGFEFDDFELAQASALKESFIGHEFLIESLTHKSMR